jgi:hypothetical protein
MGGYAMSKNKNRDKDQVAPFPFDKMPYQEKGESMDKLNDYDMGEQELDLGESERRTRHRSLGDERGAGHEP